MQLYARSARGCPKVASSQSITAKARGCVGWKMQEIGYPTLSFLQSWGLVSEIYSKLHIIYTVTLISVTRFSYSIRGLIFMPAGWIRGAYWSKKLNEFCKVIESEIPMHDTSFHLCCLVWTMWFTFRWDNNYRDNINPRTIRTWETYSDCF